MNYTFCSLAIGERYLNNIFKTFNDLTSITSSNFLAVTDVKLENNNSRITLTSNEDYPIMTKDERYFNYNLKFLPIKEASKLNTDFLIYIDADWCVKDNFNESRFEDLFTHMNEHNIDFVFERPHHIGPGKFIGRECFWHHKVIPYGLDKTDKYDKGHVCNEQFIVIKNNDKVKTFIDFWEKLYWQSYNENIWPFAEGVEIGMSTIEANMNTDWQPLSLIRDCFFFHSRDGGYNSRF